MDSSNCQTQLLQRTGKGRKRKKQQLQGLSDVGAVGKVKEEWRMKQRKMTYSTGKGVKLR